LLVDPPGKENTSPVHIDLSNPKRQCKPTAKVALQAAQETANKLHQKQARRKMIRAQCNAPDTDEDAGQEQAQRKMICVQRTAPETDDEDAETQGRDVGEQDDEDEELENNTVFFFSTV
jgi:hypothetical protein